MINPLQKKLTVEKGAQGHVARRRPTPRLISGVQEPKVQAPTPWT